MATYSNLCPSWHPGPGKSTKSAQKAKLKLTSIPFPTQKADQTLPGKGSPAFQSPWRQKAPPSSMAKALALLQTLWKASSAVWLLQPIPIHPLLACFLKKKKKKVRQSDFQRLFKGKMPTSQPWKSPSKHRCSRCIPQSHSFRWPPISPFNRIFSDFLRCVKIHDFGTERDMNFVFLPCRS